MISWTSPSDSAYGLPISRVTSAASASLLASTSRPTCAITRPRAGAGTCGPLLLRGARGARRVDERGRVAEQRPRRRPRRSGRGWWRSGGRRERRAASPPTIEAIVVPRRWWTCVTRRPVRQRPSRMRAVTCAPAGRRRVAVEDARSAPARREPAARAPRAFEPGGHGRSRRRARPVEVERLARGRRACAARRRGSPSSGSSASTGASEPPASARAGVAQRAVRVGAVEPVGPQALGERRGRSTAIAGWIEAVTPSAAKRGRSSGATHCACSIRWRRPRCATRRASPRRRRARRAPPGRRSRAPRRGRRAAAASRDDRAELVAAS